MFDVIVIGSGPAGISASIYLKRAKKDVLIISNGKSALEKAKKIENYYGIESISGEELYQTGLKQAEGLKIPIEIDEVTNITLEKLANALNKKVTDIFFIEKVQHDEQK